MNKLGIHRVTPNSKRGRQMQNVAKALSTHASTEVASHNLAIEEKRREKLARKAAKRNPIV